MLDAGQKCLKANFSKILVVPCSQKAAEKIKKLLYKHGLYCPKTDIYSV